MTPDEARERAEKMRQRIRSMRSICAHTIERCDADAVVLLVSFADVNETTIRMSTWGNALLCKGMVDAAKDRMETEIETDE